MKTLMRTQTKDIQEHLTPNDALQLLKDGNDRFVHNLNAERDLHQQAIETKDGQWPFAVIVSCIDSRTSAELIFDQGLGDVFSVRIAGNVVNEDVLGSIEYACKVAGSKLVVVLGHTQCGAVTSACKNVELGNITSLLKKIQPAVETVKCKHISIDTPEGVQAVADENVLLNIKRIRAESAILEEMEKNGEVKIVGGMHDLASGKVEFFQ